MVTDSVTLRSSHTELFGCWMFQNIRHNRIKVEYRYSYRYVRLYHDVITITSSSSSSSLYLFHSTTTVFCSFEWRLICFLHWNSVANSFLVSQRNRSQTDYEYCCVLYRICNFLKTLTEKKENGSWLIDTFIHSFHPITSNPNSVSSCIFNLDRYNTIRYDTIRYVHSLPKKVEW